MASFHPFPGLRFAPTTDPATVTAPPYDVIDSEDRRRLLTRDPANVTLVDLPDETDGDNRYLRAAADFDRWIADGIVVPDAQPGFTVYRMRYIDDTGQTAHTTGVFGALDLSNPAEGRILPHEHTTPKAKTDRLDLLRATGVNLSPIWGLSPTAGLTALLNVDAPPRASWSDDAGVDHDVWVIDDPDHLAAIADAVSASPVIIADGHHRFETALNYRRERIEADGSAGQAARAMVFVVELVEEELTVRPIHRLVSGVDTDTLRATLATRFTLGDPTPFDETIMGRMTSEDMLVWVHPDGTGTPLYPDHEAFAEVDDLDSSRLAVALAPIPEVSVIYQHGIDHILEAVRGGAADHGFLLRPATVAQIRANADEGRRMPAKTTFFHPKPATGVVFMSVRD